MTEQETPKAKQAAVLAAMAEKGVDSQSKLHDLYGKTVIFGDYLHTELSGEKRVIPGGPATIFYAIDDRFSARMANGREPVGSIAALTTDSNGNLTYEFPEGA